jgi:hypothetical protein
VPVEFWSYLNSSIKVEKPDAILVSEIYIPEMYRDYIHLGKMDYLYDKVQLYDTLKNIMQGHGSTDNLVQIQNELSDIEHHMLHFLENHDEQRIASPEFAGDARKGKPAMLVSATIGTSPTMVYFGQHTGEPGAEEPGYGNPSRTSIYDYIGVPHHVRWMNAGKFDGRQLSEDEADLHNFYKILLNFTLQSPALTGNYREIHSYNRAHTEWYNNRVFSYVRWKGEDRLIIVANFDAENGFGFDLRLPPELINEWKLTDGTYSLEDTLSERTFELSISGSKASVRIDLEALESLILKITKG